MAEDLSPFAGGDTSPPEYEHARMVDSDDMYALGHNTVSPPRSRERAVSCHSMAWDISRHRRLLSLPLMTSWDDSILSDRNYPTRTSTFNNVRDFQCEDWHESHDKTVHGAASSTEEQAHLGVTIRRTENINVFDDSDSDEYLTSGSVSPAESNSEFDKGNYFVHKRLFHPAEYFQELDDLASEIFKMSLFHFYIDGSLARPFDGWTRFRTTFPENASFQNCTTVDIVNFCREVTDVANEHEFDQAHPVVGEHHYAPGMYHRAIERLTHLIECRNIIFWAWESIKKMKSAAYCGEFISVLVLDISRYGVARLVRIDCSRIKSLAIAFETCLFQVISLEPAMVLFDSIITFADDVSAACRELLTELDMNIPITDVKDLWRCAVHILDMAVLSYAGAHTQFPGDDEVTSITLPGPFLETQYFSFRRRSFLCLGDFLGGQEAWVLEIHNPGALHADVSQLYLLTDAVTFGDIWGPMWKTCVLGDEKRIIRYNVGNGVVIPWNIPPPGSRDPIDVRKGEVFCHWMSDRDRRRENSSTNYLHETDMLLIGASFGLYSNDRCISSTNDHTQRLRDSGSLSEPGTVRNGRILNTETLQLQVGAPYATLGLQREYKMRKRSWKQSIIEDWKCRPQSRNVRYLEFKLGIEVSTCTHNARRRRLITLFGTKTMLNHLRGGLLMWKNTECEKKFYKALQSHDYTEFRRLYESHPDWRTDLGNAIEYCLDVLADTGKSQKDLELFWAPSSEPGLRVTLKSNELSWIGFLEDTETSGVLAVLEDKCLEPSGPRIGKKCQSDRFDPRQIGGRLSNNGEHLEGSILETSILLNMNCVPSSIRNGLMKNTRRHDDLAPAYDYRWSVSSLEDGDRFWFGEKGYLKTVTPLNRHQILVKWSGTSWDIQHPLKSSILGKMFDKSAKKIHHDECIRREKWQHSPRKSLYHQH